METKHLWFTPKVDALEHFMHTGRRLKVGYVDSQAARKIEVLLNIALARATGQIGHEDFQALWAQAHAEPGSQAARPSSVDGATAAEAVAIAPAPAAASAALTASAASAASAALTASAAPVQQRQVDEDHDEADDAQDSAALRGLAVYQAGQVLFRKGEAARCLTVILEGQVEIFDEQANRSLAVLGRGACFGEQAILEGGVRGASARAATEVRVREIRTDELRAALKTDHGLTRHVLEALLLQLDLVNSLKRGQGSGSEGIAFELMGNAKATAMDYQRMLREALANPAGNGYTSNQLNFLKLQASSRLSTRLFGIGERIGGRSSSDLGMAYLVMEGVARLEGLRGSYRVAAGSVLGLAEQLQKKPFSFDIFADETVTALELPIAKLQQDIARSHPAGRGIVRYTSARVLELQGEL